ncbi:nineteen complex-related protein 2-domain-containing protein [Xylariaceae sp. FL1019]|nr:nineteen complex-related protein 2-domain-containing protein [Xylariaceae sp. FL1019]
MSSFSAKRKARKITVQDDDEAAPSVESLNPPLEDQEPALQPTFRTRKPKQSSLRKTFTPNDNVSGKPPNESVDQVEDGPAPVLIRPSSSRPGLSKSKQRQSSSRLSFGPSTTIEDDDEAMVLGSDSAPSKKNSLAASALENSTYKRSTGKHLPLPMRSMDAVDDRPRYSKEYLSELQSATPNSRDLSNLRLTEDEEAEMSLDPSELEGATIVETSAIHRTAVLTESEIQEKKNRRARLAAQKGGGKESEDFISLDDDDDSRQVGDSYLTVLSRRGEETGKSKNDSRLVAEDEDLGEGYDAFVEDDPLSLGRKAEREARRRKKLDIEQRIRAAEGANSDEEGGDDSEAERLAAFEAAQTRKGMDGLVEERANQKRMLGARDGVVPVPPRITTLPDLSLLVQAFKEKVGGKEIELRKARARIEELKREREGVLKREPEVQKLLNEAGERYRALMMPGGGDAGANGERPRTAFDQLKDGETPGDRGLESLGTTPLRQRVEMEL